MLEAAEINTISSSGTQADYRTPTQKHSEWMKKEGDRCANNMLIMWANWQIKMTRCHVMVKEKTVNTVADKELCCIMLV